MFTQGSTFLLTCESLCWFLCDPLSTGCGSPTVGTSYPLLSLLQLALRKLQPAQEQFNLLLAPSHFLHEAVLHQPGDLNHGRLENRLHDDGELRLEGDDQGVGHFSVSLLYFTFSGYWMEILHLTLKT